MKNTFYILIIFILLAACEKPEKFHEIDGYGPVYLRYKPDTPLISAYAAYDLYADKHDVYYDDAYIINSQEEYEEKIVSKGYYFYPEVDFSNKIVYVKSGNNIATCKHKILLKRNEKGKIYELDHYINYNKNPENPYIHYYTINYTLPKINNKELIFDNEMRAEYDDLLIDEAFLIGIYKGTYYSKYGDSPNYTIEIKNTDIGDEYCINCVFNRDEGLYLFHNNDVYQLHGINTINDNIYYHNTEELAFKYFADINELEVFTWDGFFIGKKQ